MRKLSLGFLIHQRGGKSFSWMINHSVGGEEPVTWFSRVFRLGRNRGYGGTGWVVMIMWLTIYRNTKKGNFDGLCKRPQEMVWDGISKKGNFDGLCKQVMWPRKNKNCRRIGAYVSKSCDLPKKEIFDGLHKHFWEHFPKNYQKRKFDGLYKQVTWPTKNENAEQVGMLT